MRLSTNISTTLLTIPKSITHGAELVVIDREEYNKFIEALEELEDIRAYDEVKNKIRLEVKTGKYLTLQEYIKKRKKLK